MDTNKSITIKDVAEKAGVSIATVSRVLNNPERVKKETIEKVNRIIKEFKYECSSFNLKLDKENTKLVAIFLPTIFSDSLSEIATGAMEELEKNNIESFVWNANENTNTEMKGLSVILEKHIQGAIFITSCVEDMSLASVIEEMPVALIERSVQETEEVDIFLVDSDQGMDILIEHLYCLGHKNIGFLCGDISSSSSSSKTQAYKRALLKRNIEWDASKVISSGWTIECGYDGTNQLMGLHPEITAIICISDVLAVGSMSAIVEMGYNCPEDISVVGFDNMPSSAFLNPKLTTLSYPGYEMGRLAAESIIRRLNNPKAKPKKVILPMELIERNSTGKAKK